MITYGILTIFFGTGNAFNRLLNAGENYQVLTLQRVLATIVSAYVIWPYDLVKEIIKSDLQILFIYAFVGVMAVISCLALYRAFLSLYQLF